MSATLCITQKRRMRTLISNSCFWQNDSKDPSSRLCCVSPASPCLLTLYGPQSASKSDSVASFPHIHIIELYSTPIDFDDTIRRETGGFEQTMTLLYPRLVLASTQRAGGQSNRSLIRCMSANAKVWINKDTRVICQGFTGKQVCLKAQLNGRDVMFGAS
jgi:hypothetical protein